MAIKKVRLEDAVGMVLGHDITKIVPGEYKGPAFKKGHIIRQEDIPHFKDIGKEHIYLIELTDRQIHEDGAVSRMAKAVAGSNVFSTEPSEGRINLKASIDGLLKVNREALAAVNSIEHVVLATLHGNRLVKAGDTLAGVKIVPLVVEKDTVEAVEELATASPGIIAVQPLRHLKSPWLSPATRFSTVGSRTSLPAYSAKKSPPMAPS